MTEDEPRAPSGETLPRALRVIVESFDGGEPAALEELANRRLVAQLTRERVRAHKTQAEIAKAIERPASDISRFERGGTDARLSKLVSIADALGGHLAFVPGRLTTLMELADLDEDWNRAETMGIGSDPAEGQALCIVLRGDISDEMQRIAQAVAEGVVAAAKPLGASVELEAIFPLERGDTPWEPTPLERAIADADAATGLQSVREHLERAEVYALGKPAGTVSPDGRSGTESDLLHFSVDEDGRVVVLPVFTRATFLRGPLVENPEWQELLVLQIHGGSLLANIEDDVRVVINPWSELEFQLPSREESGELPALPDMFEVAPNIEDPLKVSSSSRSLAAGRELVAV